MSIIQDLKKMALLSLMALSCFSNNLFAQNERPNVLLLLVDDLKPTLGIYGDEVAYSPNIDRLADQGMTFKNAYCNQAVCMASRYNLLLGARSTSTGIFNFGQEFRDVYPNAVTLPQYFMNAGYHVESMGKESIPEVKTTRSNFYIINSKEK